MCIRDRIDYVRQNATIPVIETGAGVCHVYFDKDGDVAKGAAIIRNAKKMCIRDSTYNFLFGYSFQQLNLIGS